MKIAIAQIRLVVGDFEGNLRRITKFIELAIEENAKLVIFPELSTVVKQTSDLLFDEIYINESNKLMELIKIFAERISILIGGITFDKENYEKNKKIINCAYLLKQTSNLPLLQIVATKFLLDYDEIKYFQSNKMNEIFNIENLKFLTVIGDDVIEDDITPQVDFVIRLNSKPFISETEKIKDVMPNMIEVNHVGIVESYIYIGASSVLNNNAEIIKEGEKCGEDLIIFDTSSSEFSQISKDKTLSMKVMKSTSDFLSVQNKNDVDSETIFKTLVFALQEFCHINNFSQVVLGLSGGIDSAVVAVIAAYALGSKNVLGITMPSKYSSASSFEDSYQLASNLGIECRTIPIKSLFDTYIEKIQSGEQYSDLAEENLQARLRAVILMTISNRENRLLLSTGNKSESAMGYCTLYGDMAGGINPIADVYKTQIYKIAHWINKKNEIIPKNIIDKAPSAELRPGQKDSDSLPEYGVLDDILWKYLEGSCSVDEIAKNYDKNLVISIINQLNKMEYKRYQASASFKISRKSLVNDRCYPVVNKFRV